MFVTACKAMIMEAMVAGNAALNNNPPNFEPVAPDLVPHEICVEYPLQEEQWPAILIQFHPTQVSVTGLNPEVYTQQPPFGSLSVGTIATYFEAYWDLTIYSTTSQERDRLWDATMNMVLLNPIAPQSIAFYNTINNYDLVQCTIQPSLVRQVGDTIGPGLPWNPEMLVYESTIRIQGIGTYSNPYAIAEPDIARIIIKGTDTYGNLRTETIPYNA